MRVMVIVKATKDSEAGVLPDRQLLSVNKTIADSAPSHRDQWLALLEKQGVGRPTAYCPNT